MKPSRKFARQSFLGADSEQVLGRARVGVVGYGGGGSHIGQQLAHVGFGEIGVADGDHIEETNLNRLVGGTSYDIHARSPKVHIASRVIGGISPATVVRTFGSNWELVDHYLRGVHILFGAVDSFAQRASLERFARRYMIPYIDIGMDVTRREDDFAIIGQVVLSAPGGPCLRCLGLIDDDLLAHEERARQYGDAGSKPQVVWPNGVLASTAVGIAVQLTTPWHSNASTALHLEYNGNTGLIQPAPRLQFMLARGMKCPHFNDAEVGDPFFGKDGY